MLSHIFGQIALKNETCFTWAQKILNKTELSDFKLNSEYIQAIAKFISVNEALLHWEKYASGTYNSRVIISLLKKKFSSDPDGMLFELQNKYKNAFTQKHILQEAYLTVADIYFSNGDEEKAQAIFNEHSSLINGKLPPHIYYDFKYEILRHACSFLGTQELQDPLNQFDLIRTEAISDKKKYKDSDIFVARKAATENKLDLIDQYNLSPKAKSEAIHTLINLNNISLAQDQSNIWERDFQFAYDPNSEISTLLTFVNQPSKAANKRELISYHINHLSNSNNSLHLPGHIFYIVQTLVELVVSKKQVDEELKNLIQKTFNFLINWSCKDPNSIPLNKCNCDYLNSLLYQLIAIIYLIDEPQFNKLMSSHPKLNSKSISVNLQIIAFAINHLNDKTVLQMVEKIIDEINAGESEPHILATRYYQLARLLPLTFKDKIIEICRLGDSKLETANKGKSSDGEDLKRHVLAKIAAISNDIEVLNQALSPNQVIELHVKTLHYWASVIFDENETLQLNALEQVFLFCSSSSLWQIMAMMVVMIPIINNLDSSQENKYFWDFHKQTQSSLNLLGVSQG